MARTPKSAEGAEYIGEVADGSVYVNGRGQIIVQRERECAKCDRSFIASRRGLRRGTWPDTCDECKKSPPETWTLTCEECDEQFEMTARRGRPPSYCSADCHRLARLARRRESYRQSTGRPG